MNNDVIRVYILVYRDECHLDADLKKLQNTQQRTPSEVTMTRETCYQLAIEETAG